LFHFGGVFSDHLPVSMRRALAISATVFLGFAALQIVLRSNDPLRAAVSDATSWLFSSAAALLMWRAARAVRQRRDADGPAWTFLAAAQGALAASDILKAVFASGQARGPSPAVAGLFYGLYFLFLAAGLLLVPGQRSRRGLRLGRALDIGVVFLCAGLASWQLLVAPVPGPGAAAFAARKWTVLYLGLDVVVLLALLRLVITLGPLRRRRPLLLLALAGGARVLGDGIHGFEALHDLPSSHGAEDLLWIAACLLAGLAAVARRRAPADTFADDLQGTSRNGPLWAVLIPCLWIAGTLGVVAWSGDRSGGRGFSFEAMAVALVLVAVALRHVVTVQAGLRLQRMAESESFARRQAEIEARRRAEELAASEARLRTVLDRAPFGSHLYELDDRGALVLVGANEAADWILGLEHYSLMGKTLEEVFPALSRSEIPEIFRAVARTGERFSREISLVEGDAATRTLDIRAFQTGTNRVATFFLDVTERQGSELARQRAGEELEAAIALRTAELREVNARLDSLLSFSPVSLYTCAASPPYPATFVSAQVTEMLGYTPGELLSSPDFWADRIHPEDRERIFAALPDLLAKGVATLEYRFRHRDGSWRWMMDTSRIVRGPEGQAPTVVGSIWDETHSKTAAEALRESEERLRLALTASGQGLFDLSIQTGETVVNAEYARILGYEPDGFIETNAAWRERLHPDDREAVARVYEEYISGLREEYRVEFRQRTKTGSWVWIASFGKIVSHDAAGNPLRMIGTHIDITERKQAERALALAEQQRGALLDGIPDIAWLKDRDSRFIAVNAPFGEAVGLSPSVIVGRTDLDIWPRELAERYRADDRVVVETGRSKRVEEQLLDAVSGREIWIDTIKVPVFDALGDVTGTAGIARDITDRRRAGDELERLNHELSEQMQRQQRSYVELTLLNHLTDLLQSCQTAAEAFQVIERTVPELFANRPGWLALFNPRHRSLEIVAAWAEDPRDSQIFTSDDCWALRRGQMHEAGDASAGLVCPHLSRPLASGFLCLPLIVQGHNFGLFHLKETASQDPGAGDVRQLAINVGEAIKLSLSNLRLREDLREQVMRDQLTGTYNRRFLDESLPREVLRSLRTQEPLTVAIVDIDRFKSFNDAHGHLAGDRLLQEAGALLKETLRAVDIVCRFGGDEFALILPGSSVDAVLPRLEELRARAHKLRIPVDVGGFGEASLSIGVAEAPRDGSTEDELLRAADHALYEAKRRGRDCLVVFIAS